MRAFMRKHDAFIISAITAAVLIGIAVQACGCGYTPKSASAAMLTTMVTSANQVAEMLPAKCEMFEMDAVHKSKTRIEAEAATQTIHARCEATLTGLEATAKTVRTARDGVRDGLAGAWLLGALNAYQNIAGLVALFNIKMPEVR